MTINLTQPDFRQLTRIVQGLPDFATVRDRRRLVAGALAGSERADTLLARLDLDGTPMGVAVEVVRLLAGFGQVAYGKEALGVFLNYLHPFVDDADAGFIDTLFTTYPLDAPAAPARPIERWRGSENPAEVQEKIIGENTLRHIYLLQRALVAAKAVVHLHVLADDGRASVGTGFLIAPDLLMTNHHVVASATAVGNSHYSFNYQLDTDGHEQPVTTVSGLMNGLFYTNPDLDYTVLQLVNPPVVKPLALRPIQVVRDSRVSIIQHPGGHLKQISMQNNFVAYADRRVVQYTTSTLPGSSGSPVFNDDFAVIAIHHSGGMLLEPGSNLRFLRNAGSSMIAILDDLQMNAPAIYDRIHPQ